MGPKVSGKAAATKKAAKVKAPHEGLKGKRHGRRRKESYSIYIYKVLKQVLHSINQSLYYSYPPALPCPALPIIVLAHYSSCPLFLIPIRYLQLLSIIASSYHYFPLVNPCPSLIKQYPITIIIFLASLIYIHGKPSSKL